MGFPRSGKSIWCETKRKQGIPVVCPDQIRLSTHGKLIDWDKEGLVWNRVKFMVQYLFDQGYEEVIFDATNYRLRNRKEPKKWAKTLGVNISFKHFKTSKEECIQRAKNGEREDLIEVIEKQSNLFQPLGKDEKEYLEDSI